MDNILKYKIVTNTFTCKNFNENGKMYVFDIENGEWINTPDVSYGKVVADVKNPFYEDSKLYPISKQEWLSYSQIRKIFNKLSTAQKTFNFLCVECDRTNISSDLSIYISLIDEYILYYGDEMFKFCATYLSRGGDYYSVNSSKTFLDYFLVETNIDIGNIVKLLKPELNGDNVDENIINEEINNFKSDYYNSTNKINFLIHIKNLYDNDKIDRNETTKNEYSAISYHNTIQINDLAYKFIFEEVLDCKIEEFEEYGGSYIHNEQTSITIPINLTSRINEGGYLSNYVQEWEPGKRYYLGDIIIFEGVTYILTGVGEDGYTGEFNNITKEFYLDEYEETDEGYFLEYKIEDNNFKHWKRNVRDVEENVELKALISSKLEELKTYRPDLENTEIEKFFNPDGGDKDENLYRYKKDIKFNVEKFEGGIEYFDKIDNIEFIETVEVDDVEEKGHSTLTYKYSISANGNNDDGLIFEEVYHRYKIGKEDYSYSNPINAEVTYNIKSENAIDNYEEDDYEEEGDVKLYNKYDEKLFNYGYTFKDEHSLNFISEPEVESDIFIDRGINNAWERHLKFSEISTLDDLITYGNGFFNVKQNNE